MNAVVTITLHEVEPLEGVTPGQLQSAVEALADIMAIQAEDGIWTSGSPDAMNIIIDGQEVDNVRVGTLMGFKHEVRMVPSTLFDALIEQNSTLADTLTFEQRARLRDDDHAEHYAGNLIVATAHLMGGLIVKMHDSWGDDGMVVVHTYDPNADPEDETRQTETYYRTGRQAAAAYFTILDA